MPYTEIFEIDPDSAEMKELDKFLDSIKVEEISKNPFKYRISWNRSMLYKSSRLRKNIYLWLFWFWRLSENKAEYERLQAKNGKIEYSR